MILTQSGIFSETGECPEQALLKHCEKHQNTPAKLKIVDILKYELIEEYYDAASLQGILSNYGGAFKQSATQRTLYLCDKGTDEVVTLHRLRKLLGLSEQAATMILNNVPTIVHTAGLSDEQFNSLAQELRNCECSTIVHNARCDELLIESAGAAKLKVLKEIKTLLNIGLKEAKAIVDSVPVKISTQNRDSAQIAEMIEQLERCGAKIRRVEIQK